LKFDFQSLLLTPAEIRMLRSKSWDSNADLQFRILSGRLRGNFSPIKTLTA